MNERQHSASPRDLRVCFLPVAGDGNPYQLLTMKGLASADGIEALNGEDGKVLAALKTVIAKRPDVIHFDWIYRYYLRKYRVLGWLNSIVFLVEIWFIRNILGCKVVWTLHNIESHDTKSTRWNRWVRTCFAGQCEWIRVFHDSTVHRANSVLNIPPDKFRVVPEGSYVDFYPNRISRTGARAMLGLSETDFVILYVGGLRPYKGVEDLIDAYTSARENHWRLIIAGSPISKDYASFIRNESKRLEGIRMFPRFISNDELQVFLNACDVVALPFKKIENSGSVILAMGFSRAVIAPNVGVVAHRLKNQPDLLFDPGKLSEVFQIIKEMPKEELVHIGAKNRSELDHHSWEDVCQLFEPWVGSELGIYSDDGYGERNANFPVSDNSVDQHV